MFPAPDRTPPPSLAYKADSSEEQHTVSVNIIFNLSTTHSLFKGDDVIEAFAGLCDRYSRAISSYFFCGCLSPYEHRTWVKFQYGLHQSDIFKPYNLGEISTETFLDRLAEMFSFMKDKPLTKADVLKLTEYQQLGLYDHITKPSPVKTLLAGAWNAILDITDEDLDKWAHIIDLSRTQNIILISNTNELNIEKILNAVRRTFPNHVFSAEESKILTEQSNAEGDTPYIRIAPNISLMTSYNTHKLKVAEKAGTPGMLSSILENVSEADKANTYVFSQYPKDIEEAQRLGITKANCKDGVAYFDELSALRRMTY